MGRDERDVRAADAAVDERELHERAVLAGLAAVAVLEVAGGEGQSTVKLNARWLGHSRNDGRRGAVEGVRATVGVQLLEVLEDDGLQVEEEGRQRYCSLYRSPSEPPTSP